MKSASVPVFLGASLLLLASTSTAGIIFGDGQLNESCYQINSTSASSKHALYFCPGEWDEELLTNVDLSDSAFRQLLQGHGLAHRFDTGGTPGSFFFARNDFPPLGGYAGDPTNSVVTVDEPESLSLLGLGLVVTGVMTRRRRRG